MASANARTKYPTPWVSAQMSRSEPASGCPRSNYPDASPSHKNPRWRSAGKPGYRQDGGALVALPQGGVQDGGPLRDRQAKMAFLYGPQTRWRPQPSSRPGCCALGGKQDGGGGPPNPRMAQGGGGLPRWRPESLAVAVFPRWRTPRPRMNRLKLAPCCLQAEKRSARHVSSDSGAAVAPFPPEKEAPVLGKSATFRASCGPPF